MLSGRVQRLCACLTALLEVLGLCSCHVRKAFVLHTLVKLQVSPFVQPKAGEMTPQVRGFRESERTPVQTLRTHIKPGTDLVACVCNPSTPRSQMEMETGDSKSRPPDLPCKAVNKRPRPKQDGIED